MTLKVGGLVVGLVTLRRSNILMLLSINCLQLLFVVVAYCLRVKSSLGKRRSTTFSVTATGDEKVEHSNSEASQPKVMVHVR